MTRSGAVSSVVVLLVLAHSASAQLVTSTADTLSPLSSRAIEGPLFNFFGESQCDGDGNLYFHTGNSGFRFPQIFELSRDGTTVRFFQPSGKFADSDVAEFSSFWVSKDGDVSVLTIGGGQNYLMQFDGNAAMKDPIALQVPENVLLTDLSMFDNGYMFVTGHYIHKSAGHREGQGYGAILTSSGVLAKLFSAPVPDVDVNDSKLTEGGFAYARGNLYSLGADRISVISPGGELIRTMPFRKPDRESIATKLYVSRGVLIVVLNIFKKTGPDGRITRRYLVLDENTGEATHYYQPPDPGWSDVCLTMDQEMVFLASENKKHKLVTARIW